MGREKRSQLRAQFLTDTMSVTDARVLVTAVELPTGAVETIVNHERIPEKIEYIINHYDAHFNHINGSGVRIIGYMLV